jgi:hypothetical protein
MNGVGSLVIETYHVRFVGNAAHQLVLVVSTNQYSVAVTVESRYNEIVDSTATD